MEQMDEVNPQSSKQGAKSLRWTKPMSQYLIQFMVEQVALGQKVDNRFKGSSYNACAKAVNEKFRGVHVEPANVINHLRTLRGRWVTIKKQRELSGAGWDEDRKMIILGDDKYQAYIQANPKDEPFLNKPIEYYEELGIICGNDQPTGVYACNMSMEPPTNPNLEKDIELNDATSQSNPNRWGNFPNAQTASSSKSSGRKRDRDDDDLIAEAFTMLGAKIDNVCEALRHDHTTSFGDRLFASVMEFDGKYALRDLIRAYDYMIGNNVTARSFISKNRQCREMWLEDFFAGQI